MIRPGVVAGILERFVRVAADIQDRKLSRRRRALAQEPLVQVLLQAVVGGDGRAPTRRNGRTFVSSFDPESLLFGKLVLKGPAALDLGEKLCLNGLALCNLFLQKYHNLHVDLLLILQHIFDGLVLCQVNTNLAS
jgi:hypothetical protein